MLIFYNYNIIEIMDNIFKKLDNFSDDNINNYVKLTNEGVNLKNEINEQLKKLVDIINEIDIKDYGMSEALSSENNAKEQYNKLRKFQKAVEKSLKSDISNYKEDEKQLNILDYNTKNSNKLNDIIRIFGIISNNIKSDIDNINKKESYKDKYDEINDRGYYHSDRTNKKVIEVINILKTFSEIMRKKRENIELNINKEYSKDDITFLRDEEKDKQYTFRVEMGGNMKINNFPNITNFKKSMSNFKNLYPKDSDKILEFKFNTKIDDYKPKNQLFMSGGVDKLIDIDKVKKIHKNLILLSYNIDKLKEKLHNLKRDIDAFNIIRQRKNMFLIYCFSIFLKTEKELITESILYAYINKGILQFYKSIIKDIINKIKKNNDKESDKYKIIKYMKDYHYFTLSYLDKFLEFILKNMETEQVIDIFNCGEDIRGMFLLLNEFKSILESYNEFAQKDVTVYARINDWGNALELNNKCNDNKKCKVFIPNKDDNTVLRINDEGCKKYEGKINDVQFTEVYDSHKFRNNQVISKYMSLETQIAKGKGTMILTYGYSGVGKTVTLFGNSEKGIPGILQSTMSNIRGMKKVHIRVYEIYGKGTQYKFYWDEENPKPKLDQMLIDHKLVIDSGHLKTEYENKIINHDEILNYIKNNDTYISFETQQAEEILNKFGDFINDLDEKRKSQRRISSTPNNPESSRSIIIYDIKVEIETKKDNKIVPFVIVDLPGREEIIDTYADTYLEKYFLRETVYSDNSMDDILYKFFLSSVCLNPLGLAVICSGDIYEYVNQLDFNTRKELFGGEVYYDNFVTESGEEIKNTGGNRLMKDEFVMIKKDIKTNQNKKILLKDIIVFLGENKDIDKSVKKKFELKEDWEKSYKFPIKNTKYDKLGVPSKRVATIANFSRDNKLKIQESDQKDQSTGAMFILQRIIRAKRIDILVNISKKLTNKYINNKLDNFKQSIPDDKKIDFITGQYLDPKIDYINNEEKKDESFENVKRNIMSKKNKNELNIDNEIDRLIYFNFYDTPYEGIYINENINGLVKYMSSIVQDNEKIRHIIPKQDDSLDFTIQKRILRKRLKGKISKNDNIENSDLLFKFMDGRVNKEKEKRNENYYSHEEEIKGSTEHGEVNIVKNVFRRKSGWEKLYNIMRESYNSNKIYRYNNPFMENILSHYKDRNDGVESVKDYKLFYLFSNTMVDLKCKHQIELLNKTRTFIEALEN